MHLHWCKPTIYSSPPLLIHNIHVDTQLHPDLSQRAQMVFQQRAHPCMHNLVAYLLMPISSVCLRGGKQVRLSRKGTAQSSRGEVALQLSSCAQRCFILR